MTISKESEVFEIYGNQKITCYNGNQTAKTKMKRQNSFDNYDGDSVMSVEREGLKDERVEMISSEFIAGNSPSLLSLPGQQQKQLGRGNCNGEKHGIHDEHQGNRSSLIFNWLANPNNQFMFQDNSLDGHVFRSNSSVQARPSVGFIKNSLYYSLRQDTSKKTPSDDSLCCIDTRRSDAAIGQLRGATPAQMNGYAGQRNRTLNTTNTSSEDNSCAATLNLTSSDEDDNKQHESDDDVFCSAQQQQYSKIELVNQFDNISIIDKSSVLYEHDDNGDFCDSEARTTSYSLPDYAKSRRRGKLRRINSDALFYKDVYRDYDNRRRNSSKLYKKRHSLTLVNLLDNADQSNDSNNNKSIRRSSCSSQKRFVEFPSLDTEKLRANLEEIISRGNIAEVQELVACGFDLNMKDASGNCALHYAALLGNEAVVNEILDNGGSVWMRNSNNELPVELASNMIVRRRLLSATLFYREEQHGGGAESYLTSKAMSFEL
eukprot:gene16951-18658_t